jgi:hypothetical protein
MCEKLPAYWRGLLAVSGILVRKRIRPSSALYCSGCSTVAAQYLLAQVSGIGFMCQRSTIDLI